MPKSERTLEIEAMRAHGRRWFNLLIEAQGHACFWCRFPVVRLCKVVHWAVKVDRVRGEVTWVHRGKRITRCIATIDHVTPLSEGGSREMHNIVIACETCNRERNWLAQMRAQDRSGVV